MRSSLRFVMIGERNEVFRISQAVISDVFDRTVALPAFAGKRVRWCEVLVSLHEGRPVAVNRMLSRYLHFDAQGFLDADRQLAEARLRIDAHSMVLTPAALSPAEQLAKDAKTWLDRQVIAQECEWEPDHDLRLVIENVALDPRPRLWLKP